MQTPHRVFYFCLDELFISLATLLSGRPEREVGLWLVFGSANGVMLSTGCSLKLSIPE